ncbi:hypothetical protein ACFE04_010490 [Oxalis oulophora]
MNSLSVRDHQRQRCRRAATILAIATANPPDVFEQSDFPDYIFCVTNREDKVELKEKIRRICDRSGVQRRYMHVTEQVFKTNPNIYTNGASSYDTRQALLLPAVTLLGKEVPLKAIKESKHVAFV